MDTDNSTLRMWKYRKKWEERACRCRRSPVDMRRWENSERRSTDAPADRQQASIVFDVAADMVRMCPALNKRVKILTAQKRIIYTPTNSFYQVLSADAYSKHGFNIHGVVFDELHTQPNRKLFDVMTKGSGDARMQPYTFSSPPPGRDTHSICYEVHQKAKDIIEGRRLTHVLSCHLWRR